MSHSRKRGCCALLDLDLSVGARFSFIDSIVLCSEMGAWFG